MGFKLVERVYTLKKDATSPSEQAVLLALAYRANDKTLLCYPKQETLAEMTHLSRSTVAAALNGLKKSGYISWKSGGLANKKGKNGRTLSNDYKLNLSLSNSKIEQISPNPSVRQSDTPVSGNQTLQCTAVGHTSVQLSDTAVSSSRTPTEIDNNNLKNNKLNNDTNSRAKTIGSGFDFVGNEGNNRAAATGRNREEEGPMLLAMKLCRIERNTPEYRDNYRAFFSIMSKLGVSRSFDILHAIASEEKQGELDGIKNMPAFIMSRLQQFLPPF
jgi:hypothetical protein